MAHQVGLGVEALATLGAHELQVAGVQTLVGFHVGQLNKETKGQRVHLLKKKT